MRFPTICNEASVVFWFVEKSRVWRLDWSTEKRGTKKQQRIENDEWHSTKAELRLFFSVFVCSHFGNFYCPTKNMNEIAANTYTKKQEVNRLLKATRWVEWNGNKNGSVCDHCSHSNGISKHTRARHKISQASSVFVASSMSRGLLVLWKCVCAKNKTENVQKFRLIFRRHLVVSFVMWARK